MKKGYIILVLAIILIFGVTYFIFSNKVDEAKFEIEKLEHKEKSQFLKSKKEAQSAACAECTYNSVLVVGLGNF